MEKTESTKKTTTEEEEEEEKRMRKEYEALLPTLPKGRHWDGTHLYFHHGFWNISRCFQATIVFQKHFQAQDSDILLATLPKSGTTWLKALTFAVFNRAQTPLCSGNPILNTSPHELVPCLELDIYAKSLNPKLESIPKPRIFATHLPYHALPTTLRDSKCKIVYLCRNPLDHFISYWKFCSRIRPRTADEITFEEALDNFCKGISGFGPFWDQVLGYWEASKKIPERLLFLKYEDLKDDIVLQLKILAQFLGCPFSGDEEREGTVEEVAKLCSFENLKNLEVNKSGNYFSSHKNCYFFRKGEVGDWINYLTPSMAERIRRVTEEKFEGSGLSFRCT